MEGEHGHRPLLDPLGHVRPARARHLETSLNALHPNPNPGNSVAVLGAGSSGEAAAALLRGRGIDVTVLDTGDAEALRQKAASLAKLGVSLLAGEAALADETAYD